MRHMMTRHGEPLPIVFSALDVVVRVLFGPVPPPLVLLTTARVCWSRLLVLLLPATGGLPVP